MLVRGLSISLAVLSLTASAAVAESLTDRLEARRMTVLRVDKDAGRFECVEHRRWTSVSKADLQHVKLGDIVRVDRQEGQPLRIEVVRTASDEIASPEQ